jgi:hypothetical protein
VFPVINGSITLNGKVKVISNTAIQVLNFSLTQPYTFYVTLTDGTLFIYVVDFKTIDIFVPDVKKFSVLTFLKTGQTPTFSESSITVLNGNVLNPNSLGQITMVSPFSAKITIHPV